MEVFAEISTYVVNVMPSNDFDIHESLCPVGSDSLGGFFCD